jgi:hypothetical protein
MLMVHILNMFPTISPKGRKIPIYETVGYQMMDEIQKQ